MLERYTNAARRTLLVAQYDATLLGSRVVRPEHVLLALLRGERRDLVDRIFSNVHLSWHDVRCDLFGSGAKRTRPTPPFWKPFTEELKSALQYASDEARQLRHDHVGRGHVLLGLMRGEQSAAASLLARKGLSLSVVRQQLVHALAEHTTVTLTPIRSDARDGDGGLGWGRVSRAARARHTPYVSRSARHVTALGLTLRALVAFAYSERNTRIDARTRYESEEQFDLHVRSRRPLGWWSLNTLVRAAIEQNLVVSVTRGTTAWDVVVLTVAGERCPRRCAGVRAGAEAPGPGRYCTASWTGGPAPRFHSIGPISMPHTTMQEFAEVLEGVLRVPVVDETGLSGVYDLECPDEVVGFDAIQRVMRDRLGLGLTAITRDEDVLIVRDLEPAS